MTPAQKAETCRREWRKGRNDALRAVDDALSRWRAWRLSDRASGLDFPSCSMEQRADMGGGGGGALPAWDEEMRIEGAIQVFRAKDPQAFIASMLIMEIPDLLPEGSLRKNCRWWSPDQKAKAHGVSRPKLYDLYAGFRWWVKGRLNL